MAVYTFPVDATIARTSGAVIIRRLTDYLTRKGYVLGQGSVQVAHDGRILVDADRDPAADMSAFNYTQPTPDEASYLALVAQLRSFRNDVAAAHATLALAVDGTNAVQRLVQTRTVVDGIVTRFDQLVDLLIRNGTLGG